MKNSISFLAFLHTLTPFLFFAFPLKAVPPEFPPTKPLEFNLPQAKRFELSNRLIVYFLEDKELPQVQITAWVRTGSIYDPADKIGLAGIFAAVLPYGGTKNLDPDKVTQELELMGSQITASSSDEYTNVDLFSLNKNFEKTFEIFARLLREPRLDAKKLDVEKEKTISAIARRNDDPNTIARREFRRMLYGPKSPWGRRIEVETIEAITRKDLITFQSQYFHPNNTIMAVSGHIEEDRLRELLEKHLGSSVWPTGPVQLPVMEPVEAKTQRVIYLVEKPEAQQTAIRIGHFSLKRHDPDYFSFTLMNEILGGGFSSRLFRNLRSRKGLAYAIGSGFSMPRDWGAFFASIGTKAQTTHEAISEVLNELQTLKDLPPEDEEIELAKNQLINSYIQNFSNTHKTVNQMVSVEFFDYPKDWLQTYTDHLAKVTKEDIVRVAKKYLSPENALIMVVGNPEKFDRDITALGEVRLLDPEKGTIVQEKKKSSKK